MSKFAINKLDWLVEKYSKPYKLAWLKKSMDGIVLWHILISFSIGTTYADEVYCDVVLMDACHNI